MRKLLAWIAGGLGLVALIRALRRGEAPVAPTPSAESGDDPAEELRRTIAESREAEQSPPAPAPVEASSLEERRRVVHERAQEAIEAMREPPGE
jgi:hypothetical protein